MDLPEDVLVDLEDIEAEVELLILVEMMNEALEELRKEEPKVLN
jgi:hypothetical protein